MRRQSNAYSIWEKIGKSWNNCIYHNCPLSLECHIQTIRIIVQSLIMDSRIRIIEFFGFCIGKHNNHYSQNNSISSARIFNERPQLLYDFYTMIVTSFLMDHQYVHGDFSLGKTYACLVYHYCNWRDQSFSECLISWLGVNFEGTSWYL